MNKRRLFDHWLDVVVFMLIIVSTMSAVSYLSSEDVFDAEIIYVNNLKLPYSLQLEINSKVSDELKYEIEVIYENEDLVVANKRIKCQGICELKLDLKKAFYDEHEVIITTKYKGINYQKKLNFDLEKPESKNKILINENYLFENGSALIKGEFETIENVTIFYEIFPINDDSEKYSSSINCNKNCDFEINLTSNIVMGEYKFNVYLPDDVISETFNVISLNKFYSLQDDKINKPSSLDDVFVSSSIKKNNVESNSINKIKNESIDLEEVYLEKSHQEISDVKNEKIKITEVLLDGEINEKNLEFTELKNYEPDKGVLSIVIDDEENVVKEESYVDVEPVIKNVNLDEINLNQTLYAKRLNKGENEILNVEDLKDKKKLKPGIYEIEDEKGEMSYYAFGLISINSQRPLYPENSDVKFILVVLDRNGYLYEDADIVLNVVSPLGDIEVLSTENKSIVPSFEKTGVYYGYFNAEEIGEYSLLAQSKVDNLIVEVSSYFNVVDNYPFEILRDVPATIDPWEGPFRNDFMIYPTQGYTSSYDFYELLPGDFELFETDADEIIKNDDNITLIWKDLTGRSDVFYNANSPLITPYLYELGKSKVVYDSNIFFENRSWMLAIDPLAPRVGIERTCSDTFGASCNGNGGGSLDDAFDGCDGSELADGLTTWEYTGEARVNATVVRAGDRLLASCDFYGDYGNTNWNSDEYYIYYYRDSGGWIRLDSGITTTADCGGDMGLCVKSIPFTVYDSGPGSTQYIRCILDWQGENDNCPSPGGGYYDADDVSFTLSAIVPPTSNYSDLNVSNGGSVIRGESVEAFAFWNFTSGMNSAELGHNGDGTWTNYSVTDISNEWTNYTFSTANSVRFDHVGRVDLKFWGEDMGLFGTSDLMWFFLYDYVNLSSLNFNSNPINEGVEVSIDCSVLDETLGFPVSDVRVNFYDNLTGFIGFAKTDALGIAELNKTYNPGKYEITCAAQDSLAIYYYASLTNSNQTKILNVLDAKPPVVSLISPQDGIQDVDGVLNFIFNVTDETSNIKNCTLYANDVLRGVNTVIVNGGVNMIGAVLPNALYNWSIHCYDDSLNYNLGSSVNRSLLVAPDTDGPLINLITPPNEVQDPDGDVIFSFIANDTLVGIKNCSLYVDGVLNQTNTSIVEGSLTSFEILNLNNGQTYLWNIQCYDDYLSPNLGISSTYNFTIQMDKTPPVISIISPPNADRDTDGDVIIEYLAEDYAYGVDSCSLYIDGVLFETNSSITETGSNFFYLNSLVQDTYNWQIFCQDTSIFSNEGNSSLKNFIVNYDYDKPVIDVISPFNESFDVDGDILFEYNVSDENDIKNCSLYINGVLTQTSNLVNKGVTQNFSIFNLVDGYYNWNILCFDDTDDFNFQSTDLYYLNVTPDNQGPQVNLISPQNNSYDADGLIYFRYIPTDVISDVNYCSLYVDGTLEETDYTINNGLVNSFSKAFSNGNYNWYVECADNSIFGNLDKSLTRNFNVEISFDTNINVSLDPISRVVGEDINFTSFVADKFWTAMDSANVSFSVIRSEGVDDATLPWWNENWQTRREFKVEELSGIDQNNLIVDLTVNTQSLISSGKLRNDCRDLRFVGFDGTVYDYWIVSGCNSANTNIYLRLDELFANDDVTFGMYYDNSGASAASSKNDVLPLYDDFETGSLNGMWTGGGDCGVNAYRVLTSPRYEGSYGLELGNGCGGSNEAYVTTSFTTTKTEVLSFYWKVDSQIGWDWLVFCLDLPTTSCNDVNDGGTDRISGDVDWQLKTYTLAPGAHTIRFMYAKNGGTDVGADEGYIDWISIPEHVNFSSNNFHSLTTEMTHINNSNPILSNSLGMSNFIWDSSSQSIADYSITVLGEKSLFNPSYNYSSFNIVADTFNPKINYSLPTPEDDSPLRQNWLIVNVSVEEVNLNSVELEWGGVPEPMTCVGNKPDYYCYINKSGLVENSYTYRVLADDDYGNSNATAFRDIVVDYTLPVLNFVPPTEANDSSLFRNSTYVNISVTDSLSGSAFMDFDKSLIGYWNFEDVSANTVYDFTNYALNGILNNGAYVDDVDFIRGSYGYFDGTNDFLDISDSPYLRIEDSLTVSTWVKHDVASGNGHIVSKGGGWSDEGYSIFWLGGQIRIEIQNFVNGEKAMVDNPIADDGNWHHIAFTLNEDTNLIQVYIDGVLQGNTGVFNGQIGTSLRNLNVGRDEYHSSYFKGAIDEVLIYDRAISSDEVKSLYDYSTSNLQNNFSVLAGVHKYFGCAIDYTGNFNCSDEWIYNRMANDPVITINSPIVNTKYMQGEDFHANISSDVNIAWAGYYLDSQISNIVNLNTFNFFDWDVLISNLSFGTHNLTFMYNDSFGKKFNTSTYFHYIKNSSQVLEKEIKSTSTNDLYFIDFNFENKYHNQTSYILDFVTLNYLNFSFTPNPNIVENSFSNYLGHKNIWNLTFTPAENKEIHYRILGDSSSKLSENYVVGIE